MGRDRRAERHEGRRSRPRGARSRPAEEGRAGAPAEAAAAIRPKALVEPASAAVTGRVVDRRGVRSPAPASSSFPPDIEQAVCGRQARTRPGAPARFGLTDAFGRFEVVPARASGVVNVCAEHRGLSPAVLESRRPSDELVVVMEPGRAIVGPRHRRRRTRRSWARGSAWHAVICGVSFVREATTAEDGTYELGDILGESQGLDDVAAAHGRSRRDRERIRDRRTSFRRRPTNRGGSVSTRCSRTRRASRASSSTPRRRLRSPAPRSRSGPSASTRPPRARRAACSPIRCRSRDSARRRPTRPGASVSTSSRRRAAPATAAPRARGRSASSARSRRATPRRIQTVSIGPKGATRRGRARVPAPGATIRGQLVDASGRAARGRPDLARAARGLATRAARGCSPPSAARPSRARTAGSRSTACGAAATTAPGSISSRGPRRRSALRSAGTGSWSGRARRADLGQVFVGSAARLDVLVSDVGGAPVFGARVSLAPFLDGEDVESQSVATDAQGRATIQLLRVRSGRRAPHRPGVRAASRLRARLRIHHERTKWP